MDTKSSDDNFALKGHDFMAKGDKTLKGSTFGNMFGSKGERAEKAMELYKQAATQFKLGKKWSEVAMAYERCVMCDKSLKSGESADFLVEAANAIRKVNTATAIEYMNQAIEVYCADNRLDQASRLKKIIGEIYETELEFTLAAKAYQEAADFFYAEGNRTSDYNQMRIKVAELSTLKQGGDLVEAIKIFEEVADKYMENKLTAPSAKEFYFKAALLYLCNDQQDSVGCANGLEKYADKDPSFISTRQYKLVVELIKAVDTNNVTQFSEQCYQFNQIIPFDKWKLSVLNRVKERLKPANIATDGGEGFL